MRSFSCLLFLLFLASGASGQAHEVVTNWGPLQRAKSASFHRIIGTDSSSFFTIGQKGKNSIYYLSEKKDLIMRRYGLEDHRLESEINIPAFDHRDEPVEFYKAYLINGEIHMYFTSYDPREDLHSLLFKKMDRQGILSNKKILGEIPSKSKWGDADFYVDISKNDSKVLVYLRFADKSDSIQGFGLRVFDQEYNELWSRTIALPKEDRDFVVEDFGITNAGDVMVVGQIPPAKDPFAQEEEDTLKPVFKLYKIPHDSDSLLQYPLEWKGRSIDDISLRTDLKGNLTGIAGFYSETEEELPGGGFYFSIEQDKMRPRSLSFYPFSKEFLLQFMSERMLKTDIGLRYFSFRNFFQRSNGDVTVVAERYYVTIIRSDIRGSASYRRLYHYDEIIVLNINPTGFITSSAVIPKKQSSTSEALFLSYSLLVDKDRLHFIYNDHPDNLHRPPNATRVRPLTSVRKSIAVASTIDSEGRISYYPLFDNGDLSPRLLLPKRSYQISSNEALIYGSYGKRSRFGTLVFR